MSFDNVQLPSSVIADLYRQSLVVLNDVQGKGKKLVEKKNGALPASIKMETAKVAEPVEKMEPQPVVMQQLDVTPQIAAVQPPEATPPPVLMQQSEIMQQPAAVQAAELASPAINYLGGFKQQVSVVVSDSANKYIQVDDLAFLRKMMAACMLTLDDMAVINIANQPAASQLWQLMPAKAVLLFDVTTSAVGIPFYQPDFKVQNWSGAKFMNAPALAAFRGPETPELKALKRELWGGLQKIFLEK